MYIFIIHTESDLSKNQFNSLALLMPEHERIKIERYHFYADAQRSLLGSILVRYAAAKCYHIPNRELVFNANEYGKPYIRSHLDIQYNISHAGKYVVCVVAKYIPVGIDVEVINPISFSIAEHFFTRDECEYLKTQAPELRTNCFYSIWTKKESYIKMVGKGLSIPLKSFSVLRNEKLCFRQFIQSNEVIGNVCTEGSVSVVSHSVNYTELESVLLTS